MNNQGASAPLFCAPDFDTSYVSVSGAVCASVLNSVSHGAENLAIGLAVCYKILIAQVFVLYDPAVSGFLSGAIYVR